MTRSPQLGLVEMNCSPCRKSRIGICKTHLRKVLDRNKDLLLLCKDCPIKVCSFRGRYDGVCVFEIMDELDWDDRERVSGMFHRTLEMERRFVMRQSRLAHFSGVGKDFELFDKLLSNFYRHVKMYGRFKGWYGKSGVKLMKKKEGLVIVKKIFSESSSENEEGDGAAVIGEKGSY